jgi:hypothetical protein
MEEGGDRHGVGGCRARAVLDSGCEIGSAIGQLFFLLRLGLVIRRQVDVGATSAAERDAQ